MKKYFFGYLFVRIAKWLAVLLLLLGVGRAVYHYFQTRIAAQEARYPASFELQQRLGDLREEWLRSQRLVARFRAIPPQSPAAIPAEFAREIRSEADFQVLLTQLGRLEEGSKAMKQHLVERFDEITGRLEEKLRAHAAAIAAADAPATQPAAPQVQPSPAPIRERAASDGLFERLSNQEIGERRDVLDRVTEFLKLLEASAENPENQKMLTTSMEEIAALEKLLPMFSSVKPVEQEPAPTQDAPAPPRVELQAEKVAEQLALQRHGIRAAMLTSWKLDAAFDAAESLAHREQERCRLATLAVKRLWFGCAGQMSLAVGIGVLAAFLVLVFADLLQTFFDTASNTAMIAASCTPMEPLTTLTQDTPRDSSGPFGRG